MPDRTGPLSVSFRAGEDAPRAEAENGKAGTPVAAFSRQNNFDLVRLFAALQVAISHSVEHLGLRLPLHDVSVRLLAAVPGVPIFFFISGFLIMESYRRSPTLKDYFLNRALRIFPALWLVFAVGVILTIVAGYRMAAAPWQLALWALSQLTVLQFYNPGFMRGYGVGALNGSLWTIPVEMQFYLAVPIVFLLTRGFRRLPSILFLVVVFMIANGVYLAMAESAADGTITKLVQVSFAAWFYMFLLGGLAGSQWHRLRGLFEGKALLWLLGLGAAMAVQLQFGPFAMGNLVPPPWAVLLGGTTIACAFTAPSLGHQMLRGNDISYGVYIFHMPLINFIIVTDGPKWIALPSTLLVATASWFLLEKPVLTLKRRSLLRRA